ncbi:DGQHR domain-containing protein [Phosphitispora fastidiosa]|uniref:DGQHR domain-containing protein n=1 Tax=Phosphitispora fastidiosa TaxID=2837202 RepID=UPI001E42A116|nr:DGQHR domain-containing protein [Phosphitispora fastidiosa]
MRKKKKKLTDRQLAQRRDAAFRRKIRTIFTSAGFDHLNTLNKHKKIGNRVIEIDSIFIYENIILICEDTGASSKDKDHIRTKKEAFNEIKENLSTFFEWLCELFPDSEECLRRYGEERYMVFNLYFSQNELNLSKDDLALYDNIIFIDPQTLNYFHRISQSIKLSSRYEIFRFLDLKKDQVGISTSEAGKKTIKAPIIYPKDSTGLYNGVRVVSFMMSAELLLNTCYVLRKDNWEDSVWLYQRLIDTEKIKKIRRFLAEKGEAFYNNIIVALPNTVRFVGSSGDAISIERIGDYEECKLEICDEWNSICVIDGQHRIFAHFEGPENDALEKKISKLRKRLHLLVTGLIFPSDMPKIERAQIQSQIFSDINSNAKSVPSDVLLHIQMIGNPFSDIGIARRIIGKLNKESVFLNMFRLSLVDESKIKVASIIKFALRYLVAISPADGKVSLFTYWDGDKKAVLAKEDDALESYIDFCANQLKLYFSAVKKNFRSAWEANDSKILSVTSINGFIIAFTRQLESNGIQDFNFYDEKLKSLNVDFSKDVFTYTSSQYRKFSNQILQEAFKLEPDKV